MGFRSVSLFGCLFIYWFIRCLGWLVGWLFDELILWLIGRSLVDGQLVGWLVMSVVCLID